MWCCFLEQRVSKVQTLVRRTIYLSKEQRTLNVHIENIIKLLFRDFLQFIERHDSRTGNQDIEFSKVADGGVDQCGDFRYGAGVGFYGYGGRGADFPDDGICCCLVAGEVDHYFRTVAGESEGYCFPNST